MKVTQLQTLKKNKNFSSSPSCEVSKREASNKQTVFAVLGNTELSRLQPMLLFFEVNVSAAIHAGWRSAFHSDQVAQEPTLQQTPSGILLLPGLNVRYVVWGIFYIWSRCGMGTKSRASESKIRAPVSCLRN